MKTLKGDWIDAELAFRKALRLSTESIPADQMTYIYMHYECVGNFKRAFELLEETRRKDPVNEYTRTNYLLCLGFLGDTQSAKEEYERGRELFGDQWLGISFYIASMARPGVKLSVPLDEMTEIRGPERYFRIAWEHFESPEKGLLQLHRIYDDDENISSVDFLCISWCSAYLGDPEFAMDAIDKGLSIDTQSSFQIWFPVMYEVWQLPRFKEFVREIGLVDYWDEFGWPDICHQLHNGDFVCD